MSNNTQALDSFIKAAVQLKTITDAEIVEQMASVPGADFDEICNILTKAGVQIIPGGEVSPDEGLEVVDTPESDWDGGSMDSLHMYLHEIGQYPLLTQKEERELSDIMIAGRKAEEALSRRENLSDEQKAELDAQVKAGKKAKQKLVECNLRFVVYMARSFQGGELHLLDLIQIGNIGLMKGVERYDPDKGFRLVTYVGWWIRQSIARDIANTGRASIDSNLQSWSISWRPRKKGRPANGRPSGMIIFGFGGIRTSHSQWIPFLVQRKELAGHLRVPKHNAVLDRLD